MHRSPLAPALGLAAALVLVAAARPAGARPLSPGRLPAGAHGIGHIDVDALRRTALFAAALAATKERPDLEAGPEVQAVAEALFTDARGVSFWLGGDDSGALLVEVRDGKRLQPLLDKVPRKRVATVAGHPVAIHERSGDESWFARVGDLVILADDAASMTRTIEVVTGRAKGLAKGRLLDGARDAGLFFFAALDDAMLDRVQRAASSKTLQADLVSLSIAVAEVGGEVRARVAAEVTTAEGAQKIKSVLDGLRALVALSDDDKRVAPLLDKIRVTASGKRIEVSFAFGAADLIRALRAD